MRRRMFCQRRWRKDSKPKEIPHKPLEENEKKEEESVLRKKIIIRFFQDYRKALEPNVGFSGKDKETTLLW